MYRVKLLMLSCFICGALNSEAQQVKQKDGLYQQLKKEGWHRKEIDGVMQFSIDENSNFTSAKSRKGVPVPLPSPNWLNSKNQLHHLVDLYQKEFGLFQKQYQNASKAFSMVEAEEVKPNVWIKREAGVWKHIPMYATAGRIYDLEIDPDNSDRIYANPDGDGIFRTTDGGKSWNSITDNISDRLHRDTYENIIVDPNNFEKVFSISRMGMLHKTNDGGKSWNKVENKKHEQGKAPQFKWVEAFRDGDNRLVLIGTVTKKSGLNHGWNQGVYRSLDEGKNWDQIAVEGKRLQEMAFHQTEANIIYLAGTSKLYISNDAGASFKLLKDFEKGDRPMFIAPLQGANANGIYVAISNGNDTQVYFSSNKGESWELRQDSKEKVGYEKGIFGNSGSSGWTSFFAVDPFDANHLIASNVGSCESFDGGRTWSYWVWHKRALAQMDDGTKALSPHASHNADNHVAKFHPKKKGVLIKGCDAGIMKWGKQDTNWVNINGNMPAFLWYSVVVNELGDRYIAGNTQDVNIQTYRYGKWENDRGYEGDAIFMNPSTNTTYYPVAKTEPGEGLNFLEPGFWKMHSWNHPKVAVNYQNLDQIFIAYGRRPTEPQPQLPKFLYVTNNRGVSFERVPNMDNKPVYSVNVSRTEQPVLTAFTEHEVMQTTDEGQNWTSVKYPENFKGRYRNRMVSGCVDPTNPMRMWVGANKGHVIATTDGGKNWKDISGTLPKGHVLELIYHEGTQGDLYALVKGFGVFYRGANDTDWKLWMDGYNLADFTEIRIDYPAQKLLASSYGRGAWQADLQQQTERFFTQGIAIENKGRVNGRYLFSMENSWQLPAYYNYQWSVNGVEVEGNRSTLFLNKVKKGDRIKLTVSPIYSQDVATTSELVYEKGEASKTKEVVGETLFLKDNYIDAGVAELFGAQQNFSFATTIKPITEGVIAANRRTYYRDAKGWYLEVTPNGELHLNLAFYQNRSLDKTMKGGIDQAIVVKSDSGAVDFNKWTHIAFTVDGKEAVKLYINGDQVAVKKLENIPNELALNSVMNFTMLADGYGKKKMIAELKDVTLMDESLTAKSIELLNKKGNRKAQNQLFYIDFRTKNTKEIYSNRLIEFKKSN
ncbi:hypothetical protein EMN47_15780 [Prolixibacteraceae bacterium JC049]|nr:hypothetical protein [Prolixibacteraceae bacterium JC049]